MVNYSNPELYEAIVRARDYSKMETQRLWDEYMEGHRQSQHELLVLIRAAKADGMPDSQIKRAIRNSAQSDLEKLFAKAGIVHTIRNREKGIGSAYTIDPEWTEAPRVGKWRGYVNDDGSVNNWGRDV